MENTDKNLKLSEIKLPIFYKIFTLSEFIVILKPTASASPGSPLTIQILLPYPNLLE